MQHEVEVADGSDGYELVCRCGEVLIGSNWEEAGRNFDQHQRDEAEDLNP